MSLPDNRETFSQKVKREISRAKFGKEEQRALLSALFKQNAVMTLGPAKNLKLSLKSGPTVHAAFSMLRTLYGPVIAMAAEDGTQKTARRFYELTLTTMVETVLDDLFLSKDVPPKSLLANKTTKRAYLVGAFLGGGYVSQPGAKTANMELTAANDRMAQAIIALFAEWGFSFQYRQRNGTATCYIRKAEQIVDILKLLGANEAMMEFEDVRIRRDLSRQLSRVQNIDISNQQRTLKAAERLVGEILLLEKRGALLGLSAKARAFCKARVANKTMSLDGIARLMAKRGIPITRAGLNHYSRKIAKMARDRPAKTRSNI